MDRAKVIQQRVFLPYELYIDSAKHFCDELDKKDYISWYDLMASTTLLALSVEALVNTIGELVITEFKDFESMPPLAKVRMICESKGIEFNKGIFPFSDIANLIKVRNKLAHPKYKLLKYESTEMPLEEAKKHYEEIGDPLHDIEKGLNPKLVKQSLKSVLGLTKIFVPLLPDEIRYCMSTKKLVINGEDF